MSDPSGQQTVILTTSCAKVREKLAVSKQTTHTVNIERLNLKKLNTVESEGQYHAEITNRFTDLENLRH
jgi:hypothetical protein